MMACCSSSAEQLDSRLHIPEAVHPLLATTTAAGPPPAALRKWLHRHYKQETSAKLLDTES
jgi:hypothetical protein